LITKRKISNDAKILVIFRIDDYSDGSSTEVEQKVIEAFKQRGLSCAFGVVPFTPAPASQKPVPLSTNKIMILNKALQSGTVEIGLHGYAHRAEKRDVKGFSEFKFERYVVQLGKIKSGKELLEEKLKTKVQLFIPPWNSYDAATIEVLEQLEFCCLSADRYGKFKENSFLMFLPATCGLSELRKTIGLIRRSSPEQGVPVVVAVFHAHNFFEVNPRSSFRTADLVALLDWLITQEDVKVVSFSHVAAHREERMEYWETNRSISLPVLLPKKIIDICFSCPLFFSDSLFGARKKYFILIVLLFFVLVFFLSGIYLLLIR